MLMEWTCPLTWSNDGMGRIVYCVDLPLKKVFSLSLWSLQDRAKADRINLSATRPQLRNRTPMNLTILKSKIHTLKVTEANVAYNGSITIDEDIMDAAKIRKYEQVYVNNATRGSRIMTYVLPGERGTGMVCMNGGAALHASVGDTVHILTFVGVPEPELDKHTPLVIFTDAANKVLSVEEYV